MRGHRLAVAAIGAVAAAGAVGVAVAPANHDNHGHGAGLRDVKHIVVIYEENHSFDNLYGGWEGVNGLGSVDISRTTQVNQAGQPYGCLLQDDVNLTSPTPLSTTCTDTSTATPFASHFTNAPFAIDDYIKPEDTTCPAPGVFAGNGVLKGTGLPGGCTRDLVHRFYEEQYQLNGGMQNRYVTGSDAVGLTMGHYNTRALPIYQYLHSPGHPRYAIEDAFFQSAFGGSFLNHQWLVAARTPVWPNAVNDGGPNDLHSVVDTNGMPANNYPLYKPTAPVVNAQLTESCNPPAVPAGRVPAPPGTLCGDYAVNTTQPTYQPYQPGTLDSRKLPPQTAPTIGDRLSAAHVDWAWYSGGWSNADGRVGEPGWTNGNGPTCSDPNTASGATYPNCPDKLFQYHHQALNYYASFAPGTRMRAEHLRDETEFENAARQSTRSCKLRPVSIVKPLGAENEHPGYASEHNGSDHLVDLLKSIEGSACARDTMVIVTYDEFGGQWDHVPPPGQGSTTAGPHDAHGPSTRIPALVVSPMLPDYFEVDSSEHDTTSIAATIEHRYGLRPLSSRDANVEDLSTVFDRERGRRYHW
jgi:acid phosphatase